MSEEDELLIEQEEEVTEVEEKADRTENPAYSLEDREKAQEDKAGAHGWVPLDQYVAKGGDPLNWRTAGEYNLFAELNSSMKRRERDFEARIEGIRKLTNAQLAVQREELLAQRDKAIEEGNVQSVHVLDKKINNLNQPVPVRSDATLDEWNANNPWVNEKTPKAIYARTVWGELLQAQVPIPEALNRLESEVKKHFPNKAAPAPTHVPEQERGKGSAGFKAKTHALTMSDVTSEEMKIYNALPGAWASEKEFLKAVEDDRKATRGGK
jgi:hypothetical protein